MRMNEPCPNVVHQDGELGVCGRPIHDTGYMCNRCRRHLAHTLLETAVLWQSLVDATGHGLHVDHPPPVHRSIDRRPWHGPWCWGADCEHDSCQRAWWHYAHPADEPAPAREDRGPVAWPSSESGAIAADTFAAWAAFIADQRGTTPKHIDPPARREPQREPVDPKVAEARQVWCIYGDLPAAECGCGNPNATHPRRDPA